MKNGNNKIGVQERREITKLISAEYGRLIDIVQQEIKFTEGEILEVAQKKFGIAIFNQKIKQLQEQISLLEEKKKELGFDRYDKLLTAWDKTGTKIDRNTPAGRFYYLKVKRTADVQALHQQRDKQLKDIWLTDDRIAIKQLASVSPKVNTKELAIV